MTRRRTANQVSKSSGLFAWRDWWRPFAWCEFFASWFTWYTECFLDPVEGSKKIQKAGKVALFGEKRLGTM